jgi:hypothetical protein
VLYGNKCLHCGSQASQGERLTRNLVSSVANHLLCSPLLPLDAVSASAGDATLLHGPGRCWGTMAKRGSLDDRASKLYNPSSPPDDLQSYHRARGIHSATHTPSIVCEDLDWLLVHLWPAPLSFTVVEPILALACRVHLDPLTIRPTRLAFYRAKSDRCASIISILHWVKHIHTRLSCATSIVIISFILHTLSSYPSLVPFQSYTRLSSFMFLFMFSSSTFATKVFFIIRWLCVALQAMTMRYR